MVTTLTSNTSQLIGFPIRDWNKPFAAYKPGVIANRNWLDSLLGIETVNSRSLFAVPAIAIDWIPY